MTEISRESLHQMLEEVRRLVGAKPGSVPSYDGPSSSMGMQFQSVLIQILKPLFEKEGYIFQAESASKSLNSNVDALAYRVIGDPLPNYHIACQFKCSVNERLLSSAEIATLFISGLLAKYDKILIVSNSGFTKHVQNQAQELSGIEIDLITLDDVHSWIDRLYPHDDVQKHEIELIIRSFSRSLAKAIANNPNALDHIEWRDLERLLGEVFEGLGFKVEVTPPSKDGGKDLILECRVRSALRSYIIEVKHWRSGKRVSSSSVRSFLTVLTEEGRDAGLFLSTYGYSPGAFQVLTEVERQRLKFGAKEKIVSLCRHYMKINTPIWLPDNNLPEILFEATL